MDDSLLQELLEANKPEEKAAIVAEAVLSMLTKEISLIARRCSILHWFDEAVVEALLKDIPNSESQLRGVYEQLESLPFVESVPWGLTFNSLTREGLITRYIATQPELLRTGARLAISAYRKHDGDEKITAEAFFCYCIAGETTEALELLDELVQHTAAKGNWEYISGLLSLAQEAEQFPFVTPLSLSKILESHGLNPSFALVSRRQVARQFLLESEKEALSWHSPLHVDSSKNDRTMDFNVEMATIGKPTISYNVMNTISHPALLNLDQPGAVSEKTIEDLLVEVNLYLPQHNIVSIQNAYAVAIEAHLRTIRRSGEHYIRHPLEVALLLADMRIDGDSIVAALLRDVVENTDFTLDDSRQQFGDVVANILDGITKFDALAGRSVPPFQTIEQAEQELSITSEVKYRQRSEAQKVLLAMAEDPRVVVFKLADQLHNMRTLIVMNQAQQQNIAHETREIYTALARRLGMALVQAELEDLAFSYLEPEKYASLAREMAEEIHRRQPTIEHICQALREEMHKADIHAEIYAWQKHLTSINHKLEQSGDELGQIHDLVSYRILVDSDVDCYRILGLIHKLWRPTKGRFRDFIGAPKLNGYQSLHTTVFCLDNQLAEIQIRTHEMQRIADYGIASYWNLKERGAARLSTREMIAWIEQLREW